MQSEGPFGMKLFYKPYFSIEFFLMIILNFISLHRKPTFRETLKALLSPAALKPFGILVIYFMMYQFSGVNTITFYAVEIFQKSGATWDSNTCTIGMGFIRLVFTIVGCILMRRCGRRPLTFVSSKRFANLYNIIICV